MHFSALQRAAYKRRSHALCISHSCGSSKPLLTSTYSGIPANLRLLWALTVGSHHPTFISTLMRDSLANQKSFLACRRLLWALSCTSFTTVAPDHYQSFIANKRNSRNSRSFAQLIKLHAAFQCAKASLLSLLVTGFLSFMPTLLSPAHQVFRRKEKSKISKPKHLWKNMYLSAWCKHGRNCVFQYQYEEVIWKLGLPNKWFGLRK